MSGVHKRYGFSEKSYWQTFVAYSGAEISNFDSLEASSELDNHCWGSLSDATD